MSLVTIEMLEEIKRGNMLLFVGDHILQDDTGRPFIDRLIQEMATRAKISVAKTTTFPEAAQAYEDEHGRNNLIRFLRDRFEQATQQGPSDIHRLITELPGIQIIVTTALDERVEVSFAEQKRSLDVCIGDLDVAFEDERRSRLYKLRGSLSQPDSLVLTEDDYEVFFDNSGNLSIVLQSYLARKSILFIGHSLTDPHFRRLFHKITAPFDRYSRRSYALAENLPESVVRWCHRRQIRIIDTDATAFLTELKNGLLNQSLDEPIVKPLVQEEYERTVFSIERPYKSLDYYDASDANNFFGRHKEVQDLTSMILAHRLIVLHGQSGVGKTSLLLAGVEPRLRDPRIDYFPVHVRAMTDPSTAIRQFIQRSTKSDDKVPAKGSLIEFLTAASNQLAQPIVIFIDQFEEFFIRLTLEIRKAFIEELGNLYEARDLPVKVVLSLREDWLASLDEIESRIPEVFDNRKRLLPLTWEQAEEAILLPILGFGMGYENDLVSRILRNLSDDDSGNIQPPQLQIVCTALYERATEAGHKIISEVDYDDLGGAKGILQNYLQAQLDRLSSEDRRLARSIMEELITSQGTKSIRSIDELAFLLESPSSQLTLVLEKLVRARLLRVVEDTQYTKSYELAHEYLVRELELSPDDLQRKASEELLSQEFENWNRFGTLPATDKLMIITKPGTALRLNSDVQEFVARSAIRNGHNVDFWVDQVEDPLRQLLVLTDMARSEKVTDRMNAANAMGNLNRSEFAEPLVYLAVHDRNPEVQRCAQNSIARLVDQTTVLSLLRENTSSENPTVRAASKNALTALPVRNLPIGVHLVLIGTHLRRLVVKRLRNSSPLWLAFLSISFVLAILLIVERSLTSQLDRSASTTSEQVVSVLENNIDPSRAQLPIAIVLQADFYAQALTTTGDVVETTPNLTELGIDSIPVPQEVHNTNLANEAAFYAWKTTDGIELRIHSVPFHSSDAQVVGTVQLAYEPNRTIRLLQNWIKVLLVFGLALLITSSLTFLSRRKRAKNDL